jgi:hypothetical protein
MTFRATLSKAIEESDMYLTYYFRVRNALESNLWLETSNPDWIFEVPLLEYLLPSKLMSSKHPIPDLKLHGQSG